jgi:magnesium-transporting ATPase (P-type)
MALTRYMTFYNMIFTALPLTAKAIFDQDVNYMELKKIAGKEVEVKKNLNTFMMIPYIYKVGQQDTIFNNINFLIWIGKGIFHGFIIWLTCFFSCIDAGIVHQGGLNVDFWFISITMFSSIFVVASLQIIYMTRYWTWINLLCISLLSIACYVSWMFIGDALPTFIEAAGLQDQMWLSPLFYLPVLLNAGLFTAYDFTERFLREWFGHNITTRARLIVQSGAVNRMSRDDFASAFDTSKTIDNKIRQKDTPGRLN